MSCPEGVHCGLALVTRDGNATTGIVDSNFVHSPDGGVATVSASAGDYDRITAVVANADASVNNAGRYTSDRSRVQGEAQDRLTAYSRPSRSSTTRTHDSRACSRSSFATVSARVSRSCTSGAESVANSSRSTPAPRRLLRGVRRAQGGR